MTYNEYQQLKQQKNDLETYLCLNVTSHTMTREEFDATCKAIDIINDQLEAAGEFIPVFMEEL